MTQKSFGIILKIFTIVNAFLFGIIVVSVDPEKAGAMGFSFFYSALFLFLFGALYTVIFFIYERFFSAGSLLHGGEMALRQAALLTILILGILILQSTRILNWYNFLLLSIIISAAEYFILSRKSKYAR